MSKKTRLIAVHTVVGYDYELGVRTYSRPGAEVKGLTDEEAETLLASGAIRRDGELGVGDLTRKGVGHVPMDEDGADTAPPAPPAPAPDGDDGFGDEPQATTAEPAATGAEPAAQPEPKVDPATLTVAQLREALDGAKVKYAADAKKADLVKLYAANVK